MKIIVRLCLFLVAPVACTTPTPPPTPPISAVVSSEVTPWQMLRERAAKSAPPLSDNRTLEQIKTAACYDSTNKWICKNFQQPHTFAAPTSSVIPKSWTVPQWFIDPANSSTTASDSNDCVTAVTPCLTWQEIAAHRFGTISPRLRQTTTFKWLSSQSGNTDPVYFTPFVEAAATSVTLQGTLTPVATGTLSAVTAKNRATPQLLQANLGASGAVGQLVINTTHPSRALVWKSLGANVFALTQPLTAVVPGTFVFPTPVDSWTNGDSFSLNSKSNIDVVQFQPVIADQSSGVFGVIYNATVLDPTSAGAAMLINREVAMLEGSSQRTPLTEDALNSYGGAIWANEQLEVGVVGGTTIGFPANTPFPIFLGGALGVPTAVAGFNLTSVSGIQLDDDVIVTTLSATLPPSAQTVGLGEVYLDTGTVLNITQSGNATVLGAAQSATNIVWGPGTINMSRQSRTVYTIGAGKAATTFLQTGGLQLNGDATNGCSLVLSTGTWTCTNAITPAQLDILGGATVTALSREPGGASITNGN